MFILIASALALLIPSAALGVIVLASAGIRREERTFFRTGRPSINQRTAGRSALRSRGVTGLWVRYWDDEQRFPAYKRAAAVHHHESVAPPAPQDTIPHWPSGS